MNHLTSVENFEDGISEIVDWSTGGCREKVGFLDSLFMDPPGDRIRQVRHLSRLTDPRFKNGDQFEFDQIDLILEPKGHSRYIDLVNDDFCWGRLLDASIDDPRFQFRKREIGDFIDRVIDYPYCRNLLNRICGNFNPVECKTVRGTKYLKYRVNDLPMYIFALSAAEQEDGAGFEFSAYGSLNIRIASIDNRVAVEQTARLVFDIFESAFQDISKYSQLAYEFRKEKKNSLDKARLAIINTEKYQEANNCLNTRV